MWFNIYNTNIVEVENYFWTVHYKTIKWCINEKVDLSSFPLIKLCFWARNARLHMLSLVQSSLFTRLSQRTYSQRPENFQGPYHYQTSLQVQGIIGTTDKNIYIGNQ